MLFPDPARRMSCVPLSAMLYPRAGSYASAGLRTFPLLSYRSYVLVFMFQGGFVFSIHLSGMMNGLTHVMPPAGEASAVAVAAISTVGTPNIGPINVDTGLLRLMVRYTFTCTWFAGPDGLGGNVTSDG